MDVQESYWKVFNQFKVPGTDSLPEGIVITQGTLRSEVQLLDGNNSVDFVVQSTNAANNSMVATEVRLSSNDAFVVTDMCIALKQIADDEPDANQHALADLQYFNNPAVFAGANAANVGVIYNSTFELSVGTTIYYQILPCKRFERVGTAQQGNINAAIAGPVTYATERSSQESLLYGFMPVYPYIVFNGLQTVKPVINLPPGVSLNFDDASNSVWAVMMFNGWFVAQGAELGKQVKSLY